MVLRHKLLSLRLIVRSFVAFSLFAGCASMGNTPAQDLAWERWQKCNHFPELRLKEIRPNGEVWVQWTNGQTATRQWQECMQNALQEQQQAGKLAPGVQPAISASEIRDLVRFAYFTNAPPTPGTYLRTALSTNMPPDVKEFPGTAPVTFIYGINQVGRILTIQTRWVRPDGALVRTIDRKLDQTGRAGTFTWQTQALDPPDLTQTGTWTVELLINGQPVGRYTFTLGTSPTR